jgi:uncharacterized damage-inducible protein DinB
LIQELVAHLVWADTELLGAVAAAPEACSDEKLTGTLHHIVIVQRIFHAMLTGAALDVQLESQPVGSVAALKTLYRRSQTDLLSFTGDLTEEALTRPVENPWAPELKGTATQILMQVILHSQNHRGQCLTRLRELRGNAPTLDFIIWLKLGRPMPPQTVAAG